MLNAAWMVRFLKRQGWELSTEHEHSHDPYIHLWWAKNHRYRPYGDTEISLRLMRSKDKISPQARLHTRSKFCSWVHIESYIMVQSIEQLTIQLPLEVERLEKLQQFSI